MQIRPTSNHRDLWPSLEAKSDPQLRGVADAVVQRTGVDADDVPEVLGPWFMDTVISRPQAMFGQKDS